MPSTSNDPTMAVTLTTTAPGLMGAPSPGAPLDNPGNHGPVAALASAIETRVLVSPALAVVMVQMGQILDPYGGEGMSESQTDPFQDIIIRAFAAARRPTELAIIEVHEQLAPLTDQYVPPGQERVFLSGAFNVICAYSQEVQSMVLGQAVVPTQIVPGIWGARQGILAEAPLLASQIGPATVPALSKEGENTGAGKKAETGNQPEPVLPPVTTKPITTEIPSQRVHPEQLVALLSTKSPVKAGKSKGTPGSVGRRSYTQQSVRALWADPERCREDEEFEHLQARGQTSTVPIIVLDDETADAILAQQTSSM